MNDPKLFIVDDDEQTCALLNTITKKFITVQICHSGRELLQHKIDEQDIVLLDLKMSGMDGVEVLRSLAKQNIKAAIILMSGFDLGVLHSALKLAKEYDLNVISEYTKPIDISKLVTLIKSLKPVHISAYNDSGDNTNSKNSAKRLKKHDNKKIGELGDKVLISDTVEEPYTPTIDDLSQAIQKQQLFLVYQPQIALDNDKLVGLEALVRWQHPKYGLVFPDKFILLAEQSGLIEQLTNEVIRLVIEQMQRWNKQNFTCQISINISAQNISSLSFPEQLTKLVLESNIDPVMLKLEITETALMDQITTSLDILTRLRLKGFPLSIDDFGTGYSSLSQLHRGPFTELKIDQSFTLTMLESTESLAIVETCIMLGHKLNMEVIAEGVEDEATLNLLHKIGCDNIQGYYISKPLLADDLFHWFQNFQYNS